MKHTYLLAIESSCDETSVSIIENGCKEIATVVLSQMDTHANFGGVVPEVASRMHIENITMVLEECLTKANMTMEEIDAIAITYGPGLIGSLLIGLQAAKTLAYLYQKPLIPVHHIAGHIYANNLIKPLEFPLIALVVSGGHTDIIYMKEDYSFERIGGTLDDAVGEAYDKVARVLGLDYPGGPLVDKLAHEGEDLYVIADATHINKYSRKKLYDNVKGWFDYYIVVNVETPLEVCLERNAKREDRFKVPEHTIEKMYKDYKPAEYDKELFEIDKILCYNGVTKEMKEVDKNE